MRQTEFFLQAANAERLFDGIEVLALDVFDEPHGERMAVVELPNDDGNGFEPDHLGGLIAPLPGHNFVARVGFAHDEGTQNAFFANGGG